VYARTLVNPSSESLQAACVLCEQDRAHRARYAMRVAGATIAAHRHVHRPYLARDTSERLGHAILSVRAYPTVAA
jgi:hypothetical protein